MAKKSKQPDFEQSLEALEKIVEEMEKGEMSLEDALKSFEDGIKLTSACQQSLKEAEQKVEILMKKSGSGSFQSFTEQD